MIYCKSKGLHYFPVECDNIDLDFIESKHGTPAYGVILRLFEQIYKINGYYTQFDEKSMYLFMRMRNGVSIDLLKEILKTCFEENIFCKKMYDEYQILTSESIQKQWQKIVKDAGRKDTKIDPQYNLISEILPVVDKKTGGIGQKLPRFDTKEKVKYKVKEETSKESECANAHTHTREEKISVFENSVFSEKKVNEPAEAQKQMLVAEKKGKEKNCAQKEKIEKVQVRERVYLKQAEIEQLKRELGEEDYNFVVDKVDLYKGAKGKKYQDDFCAIKSWGFAALTEHKAKTAQLSKQNEKKQPSMRMQNILSNHASLMQDFGQIVN